MTDFSKKGYGGDPRLGALQGDIERGLTSIRTDLDGLSAPNVAYAPAGAVGTVWATSKPATIQEAVDRIAKLVSTSHGAIPEL